MKVVDNPAASYEYGAGPIATKMLADMKIEVVIAAEFGMGASVLLKDKNIRTVTVKAGTNVHRAVNNVIKASITGADYVIAVTESTPAAKRNLGAGTASCVRIEKEAEQLAQSKGIKIECAATPRAIDRYNQLVSEGKKVVAAFYVTC